MHNLYRDQILDHAKYPRNNGTIQNPDVEVDESNQSCGDKIKLQVKFAKNNIGDVKFQCQGCALATAASSLLTEAVKGKSKSEIAKMNLADLYKLLGGPVNSGRVKCASLGLKALQKAVDNYVSNLKTK